MREQFVPLLERIVQGNISVGEGRTNQRLEDGIVIPSDEMAAPIEVPAMDFVIAPHRETLAWLKGGAEGRG